MPKMGVMRPRGITGFSLLNSFVLGCRVDFPLTVLSTQLVWKVCVCVCVCVLFTSERACTCWVTPSLGALEFNIYSSQSHE